MGRIVLTVTVMLGLLEPSLATATLGESQRDLLLGIKYRQEGQLDLAIEVLTRARSEAQSQEGRDASVAELGATLYQAHRYTEAAPLLREAYENSSGVSRARRAIDLGNLAFALKNRDEARRYFAEAQASAGTDRITTLTASLNAVRLEDPRGKAAALRRLLPAVRSLDDGPTRALLLINLGHQARLLGKLGAATSYEGLSQARDLAFAQSNPQLAVLSLDELAQLYEDQNRFRESLMVTRQGLQLLDVPARHAQSESLISLEWRQARLLQRTGDQEGSLASLRRASNELEAIRQDLPIDNEEGVSTFASLIEPIERAQVALILRDSDKETPAARAESLDEAVALIERMHQAEMQDFLGDRCTVEVVQGPATAIEPKTGILYYVVLDDRIEILLRTSQGIVRRTVSVPKTRVQATAAQFETALRDGGSEYLSSATQFYDWLLRPIAAEIKERSVETLVEVPDSALRGIPLAALYDGRQFAIQQFNLGSVVGITMTHVAPPKNERPRYLVTGLSRPGPVLDKLNAIRERMSGDAKTKSTSNASSHSLAIGSNLQATRSLRMTRSLATLTRDEEVDELALPGAGQEVSTLGQLLPGKELLDGQFTLETFKTAVASGDYQVLHIASHGYFGGSADTSFIMTYDELLTMGQLQGLLAAQGAHENSIDLLTLSACETAEGNERAPLGIAGAAIRARAHSIVGSLWAVDDNAARRFMEQFYKGIMVDRLSRAEAVRAAQLGLIGDPGTAHPFYWAPFTLIGSWR